MWIAPLRNLALTTTAVARGIASAADAGKFVTFGAPAIVDTLTAVVDGLVEAGASFASYLNGQATTTTNSWDRADARIAGLPGLKWPVYDSRTTGAVETAGDWQAK